MSTAAFRVVVLLGVVFLHCSNGIPRLIRGRPKHGMVGAPILKPGTKTPPEMWFTQTLDHFNGADTRTFQQRYFVNDTFYAKDLDGPLFVMIGGEGEANPAWMVEVAWMTYAQKYHAFCLLIEHRFYGKTHPTEDMSVDNLQYLSSEQALADIAYFIQFAKDKFMLNNLSLKVIVFGGSYSGSLAAWFRLKYPHLASGAVATSAPIYAVLNFDEYLDVVVSSLATTGPDCVNNIRQATKELTEMMKTEGGRKQAEEMFKLCDPLDTSTYLDGANFYTNLAGNFEGVVQYNKDNRAFEGAVGTNVTIDTLCRVMNSKIGSPLQMYAEVNLLMLETYSEKCLDNSYSKMIDGLRETAWNSSAAEGGRQWIYQTCTEFGFFQTSDLGDKQPFGNMFPQSFSVQQCMDIFGSKFNETLIQKAINRTNTDYGGYEMNVTKVIFPNGSIDPWHALGFTHDLSPASPSVYIDGTAHCANMYPASVQDSAQLTAAREKIQTFIGQILTD